MHIGGLMSIFALVLNLVFIIIVLAVIYFVIKLAVKNGIREVYNEIKMKDKEE